MSHDGSWRAVCITRNWLRILHFEIPSAAHGVTAPGVGSGALFGLFPVLKQLVIFKGIAPNEVGIRCKIRAQLSRDFRTLKLAVIYRVKKLT